MGKTARRIRCIGIVVISIAIIVGFTALGVIVYRAVNLNSFSEDEDSEPSVLNVTTPEIPVEEGIYFLNPPASSDTDDLMQSELITLWSLDLRDQQMIITNISDGVLTLAPLYEREVKWEISSEEFKIRVDDQNVEISTGANWQKMELKDLRAGDVVEIYIRWQRINNMVPEGRIAVWGHEEIEQFERMERSVPIIWVVGLCGEVDKISGRNLVLTRGKQSLDVSIKEDAPVSLINAGGGKPISINFDEIMLGDTVDISANFIQENERFEGTDITVFPRG
jgi:hypothetical protein